MKTTSVSLVSVNYRTAPKKNRPPEDQMTQLITVHLILLPPVDRRTFQVGVIIFVIDLHSGVYVCVCVCVCICVCVFVWGGLR